MEPLAISLLETAFPGIVILFQQIVQYYLLQRAPHEETVMDKKTDRPISLSVFLRNLSEHLIYFLRVLRPALSIAAQ